MMKKIILTILFAFGICTFTNAQMYVSPNSYVFVNDAFVYVKQEVELNAATSNIYLRKNAQLLQGTTTAGANKGLGSLSVYQEGTSNQFKYNYWCSPVGVPAAASGNTDFGITSLFRPTGVTTSDAATILPMTNYNGASTNTSLSIAPYWIWTFVTSNAYAQWAQVGSASSIAPGLGFTMKGTSGSDTTIANPISGNFGDGVQNNAGSAQRYDFRGLPNDGEILNNVSTDNFTLVGNPYPSAINLDLFLLDAGNAAVTNGQAYFWEQASTTHFITDYDGGYGIYTPGTHVYTPAAFWNYDGYGSQETDITDPGTLYERWFTPIGQGFMVLGTANGQVSMKNSFRVYVKEAVANNSEFARSAAPQVNAVYDTNSEYFPEIPNVAGIDYTQIKKTQAPHLRINAYYNNSVIQPTTMAFVEGTTQGFDHGFDGRSAADLAPISFYYVVNGMPYEYASTTFTFDANEVVPVGFRCANETNFKIKVTDAVAGFDASQKVYLHDKTSGIYYDIKDGVFDITLPAGDNRTRFEITFKNFNDTLSNTEDVANMFQVFQNNNNAVLTVVNTLKKEVKTLSIYDVSGKLVVNKINLGKQDQYEISTTALSDGIYIVKLTTSDNLSIDKKVSIYKK